jgi:hypothetical protein
LTKIDQDSGLLLAQKEELIRQLYVELHKKEGRLETSRSEKIAAEIELVRMKASASWKIASFIRSVRLLLWTLPHRLIHLSGGGLKEVVREGRRKNSRREKGFSAVGSLSKAGQEGKKSGLASLSSSFSHRAGRRGSPRRAMKFPSQSRLPRLLSLYETSLTAMSDGWTNEAVANLKLLGCDLGQYDVHNPALLRIHSEMAQQTGLGGFCYHYDAKSLRSNFQCPADFHIDNSEIELLFSLLWSENSEPAEKLKLMPGNCLVGFIEYASRFFRDQRFLRDHDARVIFFSGNDDLFSLAKKLWSEWALTGAVEITIIRLNPESSCQAQQYRLDERGEFYLEASVTPLMLNVDDIDDRKSLLKSSIGSGDDAATIILDSWNNWHSGSALEAEGLKSQRESLKSIVSSVLDLRNGEDKWLFARLSKSEGDAVVESNRVVTVYLDSCFPKSFAKRQPSVAVWKYMLGKFEREGVSNLAHIKDLPVNLTAALSDMGWHVRRYSQVGSEIALPDQQIPELSLVTAKQTSRNDWANASFTAEWLKVDPLVNTEILEVDQQDSGHHELSSMIESLNSVSIGLFDRETLHSFHRGQLGGLLSAYSRRDTLLVGVSPELGLRVGDRISRSDAVGLRLDRTNLFGEFGNLITSHQNMTEVLSLKVDGYDWSPLLADWLRWQALLVLSDFVVVSVQPYGTTSRSRSKEESIIDAEFALFLKERFSRSSGALEAWLKASENWMPSETRKRFESWQDVVAKVGIGDSSERP